MQTSIKPGDKVTFSYPHHPPRPDLVETGLIVDEITEEWHNGHKILMARCGRTKYAVEYLRKEKHAESDY